MGEKVVALPGYRVPLPKGEPVAPIVEQLESLLMKAKDGSVRAVAVAYVIDDGTAASILGRIVERDAGMLSDLLLTVGRIKRLLEQEYDG